MQNLPRTPSRESPTMPGGGGGGGAGDVVRPPTQARGRRRRQATSLPLDVIAEIAARSDLATVVRCAATCRDVRGRVADPAFSHGGLLRLRRTGRFVLPLLRGHFVERYYYNGSDRKDELYLVDTTGAADATRLIRASGGVASRPAAAGGKNFSRLEPLSSRDGLLLVRKYYEQPNRKELCVCDPATGRSQTLPPELNFPDAYDKVRYVLLAGDGEDGGAGTVGRRFHVIKAHLVAFHYLPRRRYLQVQTFSSEHGEWGPYTKIPARQLQQYCTLPENHLVLAGVVHWLCGRSVLKLHGREARVTTTTLPASFPDPERPWPIRRLLAVSADGNLLVLVADDEKISAWEQSRHTAIWRPRPWVVIENEEILRFNNVVGLIERRSTSPVTIHLKWFAERSGAVLIGTYEYGFFWLDLRSMKIVRWFLDPKINSGTVHCPLEWGLSSWVPTFSCTTL
ncbi:hypothetical protein ACP70R_004907 [Stipagrostis hirtigluma subsp. patula]